MKQSSPHKIRNCIAFWFPRNEQGDNLSKAGWSWGVSAMDSCGRTIFVAVAHRGNGKRFIVRANEEPTAFAETGSDNSELRD